VSCKFSSQDSSLPALVALIVFNYYVSPTSLIKTRRFFFFKKKNGIKDCTRISQQGKIKMRQLIILVLFVVVQYALALRPMVNYGRQQHARLREQLEWTENSESTSASSSSSSTSSGKCVNANNAPSIKAPKTNVWNSLTDAETSSVTKWLLAQPDLNLTSVDKATSWDNTMSVPN
jgi:hypothetical protein